MNSLPGPGNPLTVLIADDSALMRKKIREILESDPGIRVVACARDGQDAVNLVKQHQPDVVTMDINMPVMDGVTALQIIMMESPRPVVMLSSLTQEGALSTFECLEFGAVDFVGKMSGTISVDIDKQAREIIAKVKGAGRARPSRRLHQCASTPPAQRPRRAGPSTSNSKSARRLVAMGVSTGGPKTLLDVLPLLPADLEAAVAIVQHMPESFTGSFARSLNDRCALPVKEAEAGDVLLPGHAYLARGGKHMVFVRRPEGVLVRYQSYPTDVLHIPSVDVMMESAVEMFGRELIGVLMTGMGCDGADAMVKVRQAGGRTIAEDESTCIVFGMPAEAIRRGGAEFVLPSNRIADKIVSLLHRTT